MTAVPGLMTAGSAVILCGDAAQAALQAVKAAQRGRRVNGLPPSAVYAAIAAALTTAVAVAGQTDSATTRSEDAVPHEAPTLPLREAAQRLGYSRRHTRRMASRLGGRKVGGVWLLDALAVTEHNEGRTWTDTPS